MSDEDYGSVSSSVLTDDDAYSDGVPSEASAADSEAWAGATTEESEYAEASESEEELPAPRGRAATDYRRFSGRRPRRSVATDEDSAGDGSGADAFPGSEDEYRPARSAARLPQKRRARAAAPAGSRIVSDEEEAHDEDEHGRKRAVFTGEIAFDPEPPAAVESLWGWRDGCFLVKWKGRSHRADTWEGAERIAAAGGTRKLDNYLARRGLDDDGEEEASLVQTFQQAERVIGHCVEAGAHWYLVKWEGLPYLAATWEAGAALAALGDQGLVDGYLVRVAAAERAHPHRRFSKLEAMPAYLSAHGTLRDYQLEGVNWLTYSWAHGTNAILADEMGLGKTIQSVAFLSVLHHSYGQLGPSLVVVPLSTVNAWKREFARWAPALNVLCYVGDASSRAVLRRYELAAPWHVLLTTYELVTKDRALLERIPFRLLLVDEGHRLKAGAGQLHDALAGVAPGARFLVTGTPLQNSLQELWSLLHFLMPRRFADYDDFLRRYSVGEQAGEAASRRLASLHAILKPHLLRRMKKDVEQSLPGKVERILRVPLTAAQRELYRLVLTRNYRELLARQTGSARNVGSLSNILMELKKVCNHPRLLTAPGEPVAAAEVDQLVRSCGKLALLDQLLPRLVGEGHRVLIFSQMVRMLDVLAGYLAARGLAHLRIDGATSNDNRRRAIDAFNAPGAAVSVFLLSTRAGGLGINLETADTVILYDSDWNPQNDLQAMARAHRIGQTRPVSIFRLVARGSVEETILERAKQKMVLDHLVIQRIDHARARAPFDRQELQAILQFGAQTIFKEDPAGLDVDGHFDLDELLSRPSRDEPGPLQDGAAELLGQFHVADFTATEAAAPAAVAWSDVIPASAVAQVQADAATQEQLDRELAMQATLYTSATRRSRQAKPSAPAAAPRAAAVEAAVPARDVADGHQVVAVADPLPADKLATRAIAAALLKWGPERLEQVARECPGVPAEQVARTCELLAEAAAREPYKGLTFPNGFYLSVAQMRDRLACLRRLGAVVGPQAAHLGAFRIVDPAKRVKSVMLAGVHRWAVPAWTILDDARVLAGVYRHGFGEWPAILEDPELGLGVLREPFSSADPKALPKALHLGRRVEYVLNALSVPAATAAAAAEPRAARPAARAGSAPDTDAEERAHRAMRHFFKPVRQQLAFLAALDADGLGSSLDGVCSAMLLIGHHVHSAAAAAAADERAVGERWRFVATVWPTEIGERELEELFRKIELQSQKR